MLEAFKAFDRDGDNKISSNDLKQTLTILGESYTDQEIQFMILQKKK